MSNKMEQVKNLLEENIQELLNNYSVQNFSIEISFESKLDVDSYVLTPKVKVEVNTRFIKE